MGIKNNGRQPLEVRGRRWDKELGRVVPWLFPHFVQRHRGQPRGDFRKAWSVAGLHRGGATADAPARLPADGGAEHGQPVRAGARRHEGDRTQDARVFDRYHIVSPGDLQDVARKLAEAASATIPATVRSVVPLDATQKRVRIGT